VSTADYVTSPRTTAFRLSARRGREATRRALCGLNLPDDLLRPPSSSALDRPHGPSV
jgi:hypothetical protein